MKTLLNIWRFVYVYSGIGFIHQMIQRPIEGEYKGRKPSNFILWVIGVYTGLLTIAWQRYELRVSRLTNTFSAYVGLLDFEHSNNGVLQGFIDLQSENVPKEIKKWWWPPNVFASLVDEEPFEDISINVARIAPLFIGPTIRDIKKLTTSEALMMVTFDNRSLSFYDSKLDAIFCVGSHSSLLFSSSHLSELTINESNSFSITSTDHSTINLFRSINSKVMIDHELSKVKVLDIYGSVVQSPLITSGVEGLVEIGESAVKANFGKSFNSIFIRTELNIDTLQYEGQNLYYKCEINTSLFQNIYNQDPAEAYFYKCKINGSDTTNIDSLDMFSQVNLYNGQAFHFKEFLEFEREQEEMMQKF